MLFALIFTAGIGYFVYENNANFSNSQAQLANLGANEQASQEHLGLAVTTVSHGSGNVSLALQVYNVGGISTTVSSVFVTSQAAVTGTLLTSYAGSPYLVGTPALNTTLPISLAVGASTAAIHDNIMISTKAYNYPGGTVFVNVLTSRGNVFSFEYPQSAGTITSTVTGATSTLATTITSAVTGTLLSTTTSWTTLSSSSVQTNGFTVGTNSLVVTMNACPGVGTSSVAFGTSCVVVPAIYQGGEVILQVSVTNYASVAMSTYVVFQSVGTNGASVTSSAGEVAPYLASSYNCGGTTPTQTIPADTGTPTTSTFTCTFYANTGATAGTVTFIGYAVGTYMGGSSPITSAEASSNTLQLGNPGSGVTGPWITNSYYFNYASEEHTTFSAATILSASSNKEVMYQVEVTNTANVSLTILQDSFLQYFNFNEQEMDFYIIHPLTTYTTTPAAYSCASNSPSAPSGSTCTVVPVGATVTLTFAACAPDSASFMWANTGGGNGACSGNDAAFNPTEGEVGFSVISYAFQNSGKWITFSQTLPLESTYIST